MPHCNLSLESEYIPPFPFRKQDNYRIFSLIHNIRDVDVVSQEYLYEKCLQITYESRDMGHLAIKREEEEEENRQTGLMHLEMHLNIKCSLMWIYSQGLFMKSRPYTYR